MKRFNILVPAYEAMITLLYDTAQSFQQKDYQLHAGAEVLQQKITLIMDLYEGFAAVEEKYFWPVIEPGEPVLIEGIRYQHKRSLDVLHAMKNELLQYEQQKDAITSNKLSKEFAWFMVMGIDCLRKKEELIRRNLLQVYNDSALVQLWRTALQAVSPEKTALFCQWMLRGLSEQDIVCCLIAIEQSASNELFLSMLRAAEQGLSSEQWARVQNEVAEGALLA